MKQFFLMTTIIITLAGAANAQDCYRGADCDGQAVCADQTCMTPVEALPACESANDCDFDEVCDEGYCKVRGVHCSNPAGQCYVDINWSRCICADGMGMVGIGEEPEDEKSDETLFDECLETVASSCGEEAPDIMDECTEAQYDTCTAYYDKLNALREACGEEAEEPGFAEMKFCCRDAEDEEMVERIQCLMDLTLEECEDLDLCWGDDIPIGIDWDAGVGKGGDTGGDEDTAEDNRQGDTEDGYEEADTEIGDGEKADTEDGDEEEEDTETGKADAPDDTPKKPGDSSEKNADASSDSGCSIAPAPGSRPNGLLRLVSLLFS